MPMLTISEVARQVGIGGAEHIVQRSIAEQNDLDIERDRIGLQRHGGGHADEAGHVLDDDRLRQGRVESVGECVEIGASDLAEKQGEEFVAAKPGDHVVGSDAATETLRHAP